MLCYELDDLGTMVGCSMPIGFRTSIETTMMERRAKTEKTRNAVCLTLDRYMIMAFINKFIERGIGE